MKKYLGLYFILIFAISVLSACENNTPSQDNDKSAAQVSNSQIKLRWLGQWYGRGLKENLIREIAREFSLINQNIDIELVFPHEVFNISPDSVTGEHTIASIVKMIQQNEWPFDMMLCDAGIYQKVGAKLGDPRWGEKYLVDFKEMPWFIDAHKDNFLSTQKNTAVFNGMAPGAYIAGIWHMLYTSSEIENRLGTKINTLDMNMSAFISYAKLVYQYNQTHSDKITFLSFPQNNLVPFFSHIVMSALGKDSADNRQEAIDALSIAYREIEKLAPYKPLEPFLDYKDSRKLYHDKALFIYNPSWITAIWQTRNPNGEKLMRPAEIPSIDNRDATSYPGLYQTVFVVPKNAKNRKEAEMLMKFISSQETADKWTKYTKCPSGLKSLISYSDFGTDEYTLFSQHINEVYKDNLEIVDLGSLLFNVEKELEFKIKEVISGEMSAQDALNNLLKQVASK